MARGLRRKTYNYIMRRDIPRNGPQPKLVAKHVATRVLRSGDITYWYAYNGLVYYSHSPKSTYLIPAGFDAQSMKRYVDVFLTPPLTPAEEQWLDINGIDLITDDVLDGELES